MRSVVRGLLRRARGSSFLADTCTRASIPVGMSIDWGFSTMHRACGASRCQPRSFRGFRDALGKSWFVEAVGSTWAGSFVGKNDFLRSCRRSWWPSVLYERSPCYGWHHRGTPPFPCRINVITRPRWLYRVLARAARGSSARDCRRALGECVLNGISPRFAPRHQEFWLCLFGATMGPWRRTEVCGAIWDKRGQMIPCVWRERSRSLSGMTSAEAP